MQATLSLHITRSPKRWHAETIISWNNSDNQNHTHSLYSTLASTLWHCLDPRDHDITLDELTLKGVPLSRAKAYSIIQKDLADSVLEYRLPAFRKVLGIA